MMNNTYDQEVFNQLDADGYSVEHFRDWVRHGAGNDLPDGSTYLDADGRHHEYVDRFKEYCDGLSDLVIDESNFNQYFFDTRHHPPKPGQILACYEAKADFIDGNLKRDIIHILISKDNASQSAVQLMQKLAGATDLASIDVIKSIMKDLYSGMSTEEVAAKPYEFQFRYFYYTYRQCMPKNDPHWWSTSLVDVRYSSEGKLAEELDLVKTTEN